MTEKERLGFGFTEADILLLRELKYKEELQQENRQIVEVMA